jgi:hypothetical protein
MRRNPLKKSKRIAARQQRWLRDALKSYRAKFRRKKLSKAQRLGFK